MMTSTQVVETSNDRGFRFERNNREGGTSVKVANERGRREFVWGIRGHPPPENFEIHRLRNGIFSILHEIFL